jgi:hypothetical protein
VSWVSLICCREEADVKVCPSTYGEKKSSKGERMKKERHERTQNVTRRNEREIWRREVHLRKRTTKIKKERGRRFLFSRT